MASVMSSAFLEIAEQLWLMGGCELSFALIAHTAFALPCKDGDFANSPGRLYEDLVLVFSITYSVDIERLP